MAISAEEINFNKRVANAPIVQEILGDLNGLKKGQEKMEDRMESLENKVDNGFELIGSKIDQLAETVTSNKEESLKKQLKDTEKALDRKNSNADKIKNYSITGLIGIIGAFVLENIGVFNVVG